MSIKKVDKELGSVDEGAGSYLIISSFESSSRHPEWPNTGVCVFASCLGIGERFHNTFTLET